MSHRSEVETFALRFKRRRDVFFEGDEAARPKSILLTTLVAGAYAGQPLATDGTGEVLASLTQSLRPGPPPHVGNPSNAEENLARHWREDQRSYAEFLRFRDDFAMKMRVLALQTGMDRIAGALRELFDPDGSGAVDRAVTMLTDSLQKARLAGDVGMSRDGRSLVSKAAAAAISIPKNTFYGG